MFLDNCNCAYTTSNGEKASISISALIKIMSELPKTPKLFTMPIEIIKSSFLPENYIILSNSVAEAVEQALNPTPEQKGE